MGISRRNFLKSTASFGAIASLG
ncbi:twin-arginine translocation signal domain-containing protein, partial [Vibrio sp. 1833]